MITVTDQTPQYGLVSWGLDIEEIGSHDFDVNSDVAFYKTWIEKTLVSQANFNFVQYLQNYIVRNLGQLPDLFDRIS